MIQQRTKLPGHRRLHRIDPIHQGIHRAQELIVRHLFRRIGQAHCLQPAQDPELGGGLAQPVEHHGAHQGHRIELAARGAQRTADRAIEPERVPQLVEQVDVAVAQGRNELRILGASGLIAASGDALQPGDQGIELAVAKLVDPPERGDDALARLALGVAMSFNEL